MLAATPAGARGRAAGFNFTAISQAATIGSVVHAVNMAGSGTIKKHDVEGGGHFQHYDLASAPLRTIIAAGAWRAKRLVSFDPIGTWGVITAGVLVAQIQLSRTIPSPAVVAATLEVVCNVGSAGLDTGKPEGFTLTVPGAPFGAFVPIGAGITVFTTIRGRDHGLHDHYGGPLTGRGLRRTGSGRGAGARALVPTRTRTSGCCAT